MYRGKNAAAGANVYTFNKRGDAGRNIMPLYARLKIHITPHLKKKQIYGWVASKLLKDLNKD